MRKSAVGAENRIATEHLIQEGDDMAAGVAPELLEEWCEEYLNILQIFSSAVGRQQPRGAPPPVMKKIGRWVLEGKVKRHG